jgi:hypothetical protein
VLAEVDLQPVRDTASAFRMHQADFLQRVEPLPGAQEGFPGLLPGEEGPPNDRG